MLSAGLFALAEPIRRQPAFAGRVANRRGDSNIIDDVKTLGVKPSCFIENGRNPATLSLGVEHVNGSVAAQSMEEGDAKALLPKLVGQLFTSTRKYPHYLIAHRCPAFDGESDVVAAGKARCIRDR